MPKWYQSHSLPWSDGIEQWARRTNLEEISGISVMMNKKIEETEIEEYEDESTVSD